MLNPQPVTCDSKPYSLGWFTTAKGQGSRNLLSAVQDRIVSGDIDAKIEFIFLSREPGESVLRHLAGQFFLQEIPGGKGRSTGHQC